MAPHDSRKRAALRVVETIAPAETPVRRPADEQLERILRSETFQLSDRLKRFLMFIVRETAAGRGGELKEYVIGVQVFRKDDSFDPRTDPIVRVQARRLRAKLVRYYREEGRADPTLIDLPKGGYTPVIKRRDEPGSPKRSVGTALVSRNTITVLPFADHSSDKSLDGDLQGHARGSRASAGAGSPDCASSPRVPATRADRA